MYFGHFLPFFERFDDVTRRHCMVMFPIIFFYTEGDMGYPNIYTFHVLQYMQRSLVTPQSGEVPPKTRDNLLQNR